MSTNLAYAQPRPQHPAGRPSHIEIVTTKAQRKVRPRIFYAVVASMSLFAILGAQLLLSIVVTQGSYQIDSLKAEQKVFIRTEQSLLETLAVQSSSQNLATQAAGLGMVPNPSPFSLNMADGSVFALPGSPDPAGCGGNCGLVGNVLLSDVPLVSGPAVTPAAQPSDSAPAAPDSAPTAEPAVPVAQDAPPAAENTAGVTPTHELAPVVAAPEPANNVIPTPITR